MLDEMRALRGLTIAFGFFAASFALHIVGGATDQGWLFALAVALIYVAATGFPAVALMASGLHAGADWPSRLTLGLGAVAGAAFTVGALWATNGRAFAWWEFALAPILVVVMSVLLLALVPRGTSRVPRSRAKPRPT